MTAVGGIGKTIMIVGGALLVLGALLMLAERAGGRLLPGDIVIRRGNSTFYFPIVTCILLSILLTLVLYVVNLLRR